MAAGHALILAAVIASAGTGSLPPETCAELAMRFRACTCRFVPYRGWRCEGFFPRTASETRPTFPDAERSVPMAPDPLDLAPIQ